MTCSARSFSSASSSAAIRRSCSGFAPRGLVPAIGWLSYTGDLDTCIHIRTVVIKDGIAHIQAGGGTVADARPDYEYEESVAKSRAVRDAVALACEQPDWP